MNQFHPLISNKPIDPAEAIDEIIGRIQTHIGLIAGFVDQITASYVGCYYASSLRIDQFVEAIRPFCYSEREVNPKAILEWLKRQQVLCVVSRGELQGDLFFNENHPFFTACYRSAMGETFENTIIRRLLNWLSSTLACDNIQMPADELQILQCLEAFAKDKLPVDPYKIIRTLEEKGFIHIVDGRALYYTSSERKSVTSSLVKRKDSVDRMEETTDQMPTNCPGSKRRQTQDNTVVLL
jgi:hypothetical protein